MALPYWISTANNGKYYIHFKITQAAGSVIQYTIKKESGFTPEAPNTFWDFFDDFSGTTLDTTVWNTSTIQSQGQYSVSNGLLHLWNDWSGCCNGQSCYYNGISTHSTFTPPLQIVYKFKQDPYEASSNCGRTGPSVELMNQATFIPSTNTNTNEGGAAIRVGTSSAWVPIAPMLQTDMQVNVHIRPTGVDIFNHWDDNAQPLFSFTGNVGGAASNICIAGDTDSTTVIDHVDWIAVSNSGRDPFPNIRILTISSTQIVIEVDDSNYTGTDVLQDFVVTIEAGSFISGTSESLNIYSSTAYGLFADANDNVYHYDASNNNLVQLTGKTISNLTETDFTTYGFVNSSNISKSVFVNAGLQTPRVLMFSSESNISKIDLSVKFLPYKRFYVSSRPKSLKMLQLIKSFRDVFVEYGSYQTGTYNKILFSRDGNEWFKYDNASNTFVSVGTKSLDPYNQNDIDWVDTNADYIGNVVTNSTETAWGDFFNNQYPDQIWIALLQNYSSFDYAIRFKSLNFVADTKDFYKLDNSPAIKVTPETIMIEFPNAGKYLINYLD